jgi:hypothetical protein
MLMGMIGGESTSTVHVAVPSYANPGGTGDRTGSITITWSGTTGGGAVTDLIDGTQSNELFWTAGQTNKVLKFDFGVGASKVINEFKWYQDVAVGHGSNQSFEGSNNDSSWTTFPDVFGLGATPTQTVTITNSAGFRYYRINFPGAISASPYLREIEFKIDDA